jgi:hypothetical protein
MHVKKSKIDSYFYMLVAYLFLVGNSSWFIYGNILYYREDHPNRDETTQNRVTIKLMLYLGYLTMCKCFLYSCVLMIGIPMILHVRRQREDFEAASDNLLARFAVVKFDGLFDMTEECVICLHELTGEEGTVVRLPCNDKHVFHRYCIREWMKKKNTCPLCNLEINE